MTEDRGPSFRPSEPLATGDEDHVFTIRLWLEPGGDGGPDGSPGGDWRGKLRHRGTVTPFIGLARLFELIARALQRLPGQGGR